MYPLFKILPLFVLVFGLSGIRAAADHIPDALFLELFHELNTPHCIYSNREEGTSLDCDNPDPAKVACWQEKLHWDYDREGLQTFVEEVRASNEKYEYYNATYYNEFISNRNWDNIMSYIDNC